MPKRKDGGFRIDDKTAAIGYNPYVSKKVKKGSKSHKEKKQGGIF